MYKSFLNQKDNLTQYLYFLAVTIFYWTIQFSTNRVISVDGNWHIALSRKMWSDGIIHKLPELAFTIFKDYYREHHFLYQVLYMPFALIENPYMGAKLAAFFFSAILGCFFITYLRNHKIKLEWIFISLFLVGSAGFLYRIIMTRVQSVSLIWILGITYCLIFNRKKILAILAFTFVWLYDAFFLIYPITFLFIISDYIHSRKIKWNIILIIILSTIIGMIINPYFPENIQSYWFNIYRSIISTDGVLVGVEWRPYSLPYYWRTNYLIIIPFICSVLIHLLLIFTKKIKEYPDKKALLFYGLLSFMFIGLSLKSRRFIEYMPPFPILYIALILKYLLSSQKKFLWQTYVAISILAIIFIGQSGKANIKDISYYIRPRKELECYQSAAKWLHENVKKDEVIFSTDWDDFPHLYVGAPNLKYIVGLDPLFMDRYDSDLYKKWVDLTQARGEGSLAERIYKLFRSKYIFVDDQHHKFESRLKNEKNTIPDIIVKKTFSGKTCRIYEYQPESE